SRESSDPYGLTVTFYKAYQELLIPHVLTLYEELAGDKEMPPSLKEELIIPLPKPGKPQQLCSSYRHLALINVDTKIYATILANRLAPLLPMKVGAEQTGFAPGHSLTLNIRNLLVTIQHIDPVVRVLAIFLDDGKAFDSIKCVFMLQVLRRMGV
ncbi:hypothetical protein NDU88_001646, partial [Pleurodeles waltl]